MRRRNHHTMLQQAGCYFLLFALVGAIGVSVAGTAEPLSLEAIKSRLRERQEKINSLYVRVRRETKISVEPGVLRTWSGQMSFPKYLGTDEVLFAFKGDKRYRRLLGLDYRSTLPTESAPQGGSGTGITTDEAKATKHFFGR